MRNVSYSNTSDSGYCCSKCGKDISPEFMFNDNFECGHSAYAEYDKPEWLDEPEGMHEDS